jgi:hypothetical protein
MKIVRIWGETERITVGSINDLVYWPIWDRSRDLVSLLDGLARKESVLAKNSNQKAHSTDGRAFHANMGRLP